MRERLTFSLKVEGRIKFRRFGVRIFEIFVRPVRIMSAEWLRVVGQRARVEIAAKYVPSVIGEGSVTESALLSRVALGVGVEEFARKLAMHKQTVVAFA